MPQADLTYVPDFRHLMEATSLLAQRRYTPRQQWIMAGVVFGTMLTGGVLAGVMGPVLHNTLLPSLPEWAISIILLLGLAVFFFKVLQPWLVRRSGEFINAARLRVRLRFTADETGLRWADPDIDFRLNWSGVEAVYATKNSLCFMTGAMGLVLPFSAFPDDAARRNFLRDVLQVISPEAAARSHTDKSIARLVQPS